MGELQEHPGLAWASCECLATPISLCHSCFPTAANMNLDRIGEQAEAMFGVG